MFVQSEKSVEEHGGRIDDIVIFGQKSNPTTWRLCKMNLAIRGIDGDLAAEHADTFRRDLHKDLKADFVLANPPFNDSDWGGDKLHDDVRWAHGAPAPLSGYFDVRSKSCLFSPEAISTSRVVAVLYLAGTSWP
jgi:type I restriction enzyme M protein